MNILKTDRKSEILIINNFFFILVDDQILNFNMILNVFGKCWTRKFICDVVVKVVVIVNRTHKN